MKTGGSALGEGLGKGVETNIVVMKEDMVWSGERSRDRSHSEVS